MQNHNYAKYVSNNICVCRKCTARYEARTNESRVLCELCRDNEAPRCIHNVSTLDDCSQCKVIHGQRSTIRSVLPMQRKAANTARMKTGRFPIAR